MCISYTHLFFFFSLICFIFSLFLRHLNFNFFCKYSLQSFLKGQSLRILWSQFLPVPFLIILSFFFVSSVFTVQRIWSLSSDAHNYAGLSATKLDVQRIQSYFVHNEGRIHSRHAARRRNYDGPARLDSAFPETRIFRKIQVRMWYKLIISWERALFQL